MAGTPDTEDLEAQCVAAGMKLTRPRRVILDVLRAAADHPSADQIFERARAAEPGIALGTVYRNLGVLEEAGLVLRHEFGQGFARYELATHRHGHLIDRDTGAVVEFACEALEKTLAGIAASRGYALDDYHVRLWGRRTGAR